MIWNYRQTNQDILTNIFNLEYVTFSSDCSFLVNHLPNSLFDVYNYPLVITKNQK